ncbi:hypothetical protein NS228_06270 [Methylobacterium indicum]|nr:hypothetical protein NS229_14560 [Methylobacterium indicum]KTS41562.1 hypothetical protein NS228_06270 [Methylobacterium indicum]
MGEATKISSQVDKLTRSLLEQQKAANAVATAMKARAGYGALNDDLKRTNAALAASAKAYDEAKRAKAAFDGVKAPKGSDQARQITETNKALREAGAAYRKAEGDVRRVNAAISAQASVMHQAESAAAALGADLSNLAAHERKLVGAIDAGTAAIKRQMAAEEHGARVSEQAAARRQRRRDAIGTIASGAAVVAAHRGKEIGMQAINAAGSMDYAQRYQVVATDVTEQDQARILTPQAKRIGQETKFSNEDVVHAQTGTMQGLPFKDPKMKAEVGASIVDQARHYAVIMQSDMTRSSEGIRSFLQNTNKDISTPEKAFKEAQRGTNLIVKMAKLGGMSDEDAQAYIKFGFPTGTQVGLSDTTLGALGAGGRRAGLRGDELGVFARAAASKLVAPTSKGLDALTAAGIRYNDFTRMPGGLSTGNLEAFSKRRFGKGFSDSQRSRLGDLLDNGEVVGDRDEFTKQVSPIIAESYRKGKKGKVTAQDSAKIAKMVGDFHKLSVESVDSEGLLRAILSNPKMTAALRNAYFTDKHGGKAGMISSKMDQFNQDYEELKHVEADPKFAEKKSLYMTQGLGGSLDNLKGSFETLVLNVGQANEGLIRFAADGIAKGTDLFSNLSKTQQQVLSLAAGGAAMAGGAAGAYKLTSALLGGGGASVALDGSAAKLTGAAAALEAAAARLGAGGIPGGPGGNNVAAVPGGGPGAKPGTPPRATIGGALTFMGVAGAIGYAGWKGLEAVDAWMPTARPGARFSPLGNAIPGKGGEVYGPPMPSQRPRSLRQIRNGLDADDRPLSQSSPPPAPAAIPTAPSMTLQPGNASPGIGTTGLKAFGLDGIAEGAAKAGQEAGTKAGEGMRQGIEGKRSEVIGSATQTFASIQAVFGAGVTVPVRFDTSGVAAAASAAKAAASSGASQMAQAISTPLPAAARGGSMNGAADRMEAAANRMAEMSVRTHHTVEVSASPGLQARTRNMQASTRGPMRSDLGVTMPSARVNGEFV